MKNSRAAIEKLLASGLAPSPPAALRARVLRAARSRWPSAAAPEPTVDLWQRVWESSPLRLAWSAIVLALALAHGIVGREGRERVAPDRPQGGASAESVTMVTAPATEAAGELAEVIDLPALRLSSRGWLGARLEPPRQEPLAIPPRPSPSPVKEIS